MLKILNYEKAFLYDLMLPLQKEHIMVAKVAFKPITQGKLLLIITINPTFLLMYLQD